MKNGVTVQPNLYLAFIANTDRGYRNPDSKEDRSLPSMVLDTRFPAGMRINNHVLTTAIRHAKICISIVHVP